MNAYELAQKEVGTVEWAKGDNPKVVAYFKDSGNAGVTDDETAWCAAFVGAMLKRAGGKGTGKLNARSYLEWGTPVERKDARPGDVAVFKRGNSTWQGHVAFFVKDKGALIEVLGGNQSDAVNVKGYQASQLLGIRRAPLTSKPVADSNPPVSATKSPPLAPSKPTAAPAPQKPAKPRTGPALVAGGIVAVVIAARDTLAEWWQNFVNLF